MEYRDDIEPGQHALANISGTIVLAGAGKMGGALLTGMARTGT